MVKIYSSSTRINRPTNVTVYCLQPFHLKSGWLVGQADVAYNKFSGSPGQVQTNFLDKVAVMNN